MEGDKNHTPVQMIKVLARELSEKMDEDIANKTFNKLEKKQLL